MKAEISVVVPVYNEQELLVKSVERLTGVMHGLGCPFEIILVDDGSSDRSCEIAARLCSYDERLKLIALSRNFGHQAAITAGMDYAAGDCVVVIDADMQDPPELIPQMYKLWKEGWQVVYGLRSKRLGESAAKLVTANLFYRVLDAVTETQIPRNVGDFRLIDRKVCDAMKSMPERGRYVRGLVSWTGFRQTALEYVRHERMAGKTKYTLKKMVKLAGNGLLSFSKFPLRLPMYLGAAVCLLSLIAAIVALCAAEGAAAAAFAACFVGGLCLLCLGFIGCYIGRILDQTQQRPEYIVNDTINM